MTAPHFPPPAGKKWYEGRELREELEQSRFIGRSNELQQIIDRIGEPSKSLPKLVALTGSGGIGYL